MNEAIDAPDEMSPFAPRVISVKVPVDKIGEVIGPKGKMINQIQEDTGADISIEDDGTVYIGATDGPSAEAARNAINAIANPTMPEIGERFLGTVVKTTTFGAFVSLLPGKDGLLHISEVRKLVGGKRIDSVDDVLSIGQKVQVELKEVDPRGKLSLGAVLTEEQQAAADAAAADEGERRGPRGDRPERGDRGDRGGRGDRPERGDRGDRGDRPERGDRRPRRDDAEGSAPESHDAGNGDGPGDADEGGERRSRSRRRRPRRDHGGDQDNGAERDNGGEGVEHGEGTPESDALVSSADADQGVSATSEEA
jgi:polyribonucleotide nucleotidyltransferase